MKNSPEMSFCFNLKISPSCQTLSKALDMSKETLLTSDPLSKDVKISWVIDNSWLMQESPGWKPDWFLQMTLLAEKLINISLKITLSNILLQIESKETG